MLHVPWRSLGAGLGVIVIGTICSWWRGGASGVAPLNTVLDVRPLNLRRVPSTVGGVNRRLRRRTLLTTKLV
jgi:hypothetical protein